MEVFLSLLLATIFYLLSLLHCYWVGGGKWGFEAALPTKESGERIMNPRKIDSAIVGLGLFAFGSLYLLHSGIVPINLPSWVWRIGSWIVPGIFLLRAIGEFRYVGFFKKVRNTPFGQRDTKYYAPLCLGIGIIGLVIAWM
ncbi:MAG: DUF3995 domain-containing protein [Bacteroidota bacterium]